MSDGQFAGDESREALQTAMGMIVQSGSTSQDPFTQHCPWRPPWGPVGPWRGAHGFQSLRTEFQSPPPGFQWQESLAMWGIHTPEDLIRFDEWACCELGMTWLDSRKLPSIAASGAVFPQTMTYPAPGQQIYLSGLRKEIAFAEAVVKAERYARSCLGDSLAFALKVQAGPPDGPEDICVQCIRQAMEYLVQPPQEP